MISTTLSQGYHAFQHWTHSSLQCEREEEVVGVGLEESVAPARQVGEAGHLAVVERPAADLLVRQRQLVQTPVSRSGNFFFLTR